MHIDEPPATETIYLRNKTKRVFFFAPDIIPVYIKQTHIRIIEHFETSYAHHVTKTKW